MGQKTIVMTTSVGEQSISPLAFVGLMKKFNAKIDEYIDRLAKHMEGLESYRLGKSLIPVESVKVSVGDVVAIEALSEKVVQAMCHIMDAIELTDLHASGEFESVIEESYDEVDKWIDQTLDDVRRTGEA